VLSKLNEDELIKGSGYTINIMPGKKDAQKGLPLN